MRFSLGLPIQAVQHPEEFVTAQAIADVTRAAAAAGFSAVNVTDHPAPDTRWVDSGGHYALDPFVALSFAAAADPDIRLLTHIYVAAYHNPFIGANLVRSLHLLTEGRLILGVAAGYLKPEFSAVGVDFDRRTALLDDALEVLELAMTGADIQRDGPGYHARGVRYRPVPADNRRPPVWIGGNSTAAMRRAAGYEGWAPFHTGGFARAARTAPLDNLDDLGAAITHVRSLKRENGTDDRGFDVCWAEPSLSRVGASTDERCSRLSALARAGVTWTVVAPPSSNRGELLTAIAAFGRDVIAETGGSL